MFKAIVGLVIMIGVVIATSDDNASEFEWYLFQIKDWVGDHISWIMYNMGR